MRRMLARWQYVEVRLAVVCALLSGLFRPASESLKLMHVSILELLVASDVSQFFPSLLKPSS